LWRIFASENSGSQAGGSFRLASKSEVDYLAAVFSISEGSLV
jgi:hypothetical protein